MRKIVYIIPGYGESCLKQRAYPKVARLFEASGFEVIPVEIDWNYKTPARFKDWAAQFLKQYKRRGKGDMIYVLGFSFGATIAFLTESKTKPDVLMLCSLSPYFTEDLATFKPSWIRWWKKNISESDYTFGELAPKIKSKTIFFVGSEEGESYGVSVYRAKEGKKLVKNSELNIIKGAKHRIGQKEYLATIEKFLNKSK